jgi:hypothetical protein
VCFVFLQVPFEFKLLPDKRTTPIKGVTFELNDETNYPRLREAAQFKPNVQSIPNGTAADMPSKPSRNSINLRLYVSVALIIAIVYFLYSYIQDTNPKNPIMDI